METNKTRLLVDAGISGVQAQNRMAEKGLEISSVDALLITHDHSDHIRCAGVYSRKWGIPVWVSQGTWRASKNRKDLGNIAQLNFFHPGETILLGDLRVETVPTPHDATEGSVFVFDDGSNRLGVLTDLGHVFPDLEEVMKSLNGAFLESNYDQSMLENGDYPVYLKKRIRGDGGHISNDEAAELLSKVSGKSLAWVCLSHLSGENNTPQHALETSRRAVGNNIDLLVARRDRASDFFLL